jgi:hypothetical protein
MIDGHEQIQFEKWVQENYPKIMDEWENDHSMFMELDEFLINDFYKVWKEWRNFRTSEDYK